MKKPNQSSEPTTMAVMICADAQLTPAIVVAHLERWAKEEVTSEA
jgi:hypothetical protein